MSQGAAVAVVPPLFRPRGLGWLQQTSLTRRGWSHNTAFRCNFTTWWQRNGWPSRSWGGAFTTRAPLENFSPFAWACGRTSGVAFRRRHIKRVAREGLERLLMQVSVWGARMAEERPEDYHCHPLLRGRETENSVEGFKCFGAKLELKS